MNMLGIAALFAIILATSVISIGTPAVAETGQGKDVFRVIMTVFGVNGDIINVVGVNDGEAVELNPEILNKVISVAP